MSESRPLPNFLVKGLLLLFLSSISLYFVYQALYALGFFVWPVSGIVLDENTNKPIEDATVVASWQGQFFGTVHVHEEITYTNIQGRYATPFRWRASKLGLVDGRSDHVSVYKPGYEVSENTYDFSIQDRKEY